MSLTDTMDNIYATRVLRIMLLPFEKQKAFSLGLINKEGNEIRKPITPEEKSAYDPLHQVLFKLKQLINKLPGGEFRTKQLALVLNVIKQRLIPKQYLAGISEEFATEYLNRLLFIHENKLYLAEEESLVRKYLSEEGEAPAAPTNTTAGIAPQGEPVIDPKKKKKEEIVTRKELTEENSYPNLYVSRKVLNYKDISDWAKSVGCISTQHDDLHVTICYSREKVSDVIPDVNNLTIKNSERSLELFGPKKNYLVLKIKDKNLVDRHNYFASHGASYDWGEYKPHITISNNVSHLDIDSIKPFDGNIILGPEIFEELDLDWQDKVEEK